MSISRLPNGRWRAQVYHDGKNLSVAKVLGLKVASFDRKADAKRAREEARQKLARMEGCGPTLAEFAQHWTTSPLFAYSTRGVRKDSTRIYYAQQIREFVRRYGDLPMRRIDRHVVREWLADGKKASTVFTLRVMFSDAMSGKAGELIDRNPFSSLGITKGPGNRYVQPPTEEMVWKLIQTASEITFPAFTASLQVGCFTGMRPAELFALKWADVDFASELIVVREQRNKVTRTYTTPKNSQTREALLTPHARSALLGLTRQGPYCFTNMADEPFTYDGHRHHWEKVREAAGFSGTLYQATRHFFGWYGVNVLELPSEVVAIAMGHDDDGNQVRRVYGHRDHKLAQRRALEAFKSVGDLVPLRVVEGPWAE